MWNKKLALGTSASFGIDFCEQVKLFKQVGFDAVFFCWEYDSPIDKWMDTAKECDMIIQSLHAPFKKAADFWGSDAQSAQIAIDELKACLDDCKKYNVPIMVVHAFIGFKDHSPTEIGVKRYAEVVEYAKKLNIKVAFENTEGEEYLAALMNEFKGNDTVGFCWDSGHEMCYNHSKDMLGLYGDRLIATHLNDNLGIKDFNGEITYRDDLHLLPFDGIADWDYNVSRLKKATCPEILTFELTTLSKKERHDNDIYKKMDFVDYLCECYKRACKIAAKLVIR